MAKPVAQRLFFALWPEPETAQQIWRVTDKLVAKGKGRRLPAHQLHLTLAYLGYQDVDQLRCVSDVAGQLQAQPFTLTLDLSGHFPRPQVVWLGTTHVPVMLKALQADLVSQLAQFCAYIPETRPFVPHITISRKVKRLDLPAWQPLISWPVSNFVLASSQTLPTGAQYTVLRSWPLVKTQ